MKKFLSLVLALVMTMSLVTISAGAKTFEDDDAIDYTEAVEVMKAVKVVDGYADGTFNPDSVLTRGAAAKIICNMILGPTTASALVADAAPYKDVPASNVFSGYITYCAKQGIISGYADGTFRPGNTLTGYAFMKMLLGALGYDAAQEGYTGANWSIQVAKQAIAIGLDDGLLDDFDGVKPVTRQEACLYAFNTMQARLVEYTEKTVITTGDVQVTTSGNRRDVIANASTKIKGVAVDGNNYCEFAEKYFSKLEVKRNASDDYGRPANTWYNNAKKIGTYTDTPVLVYTDRVKSKTVYADLGRDDDNLNAYYVVNDGQNDDTFYNTTEFTNIAKGNDDDYVGNGKKGTVTEIYLNDDETIAYAVVIHPYVGKVSSVSKNDDGDRVVRVTGSNGTNPVYKTEDFAKGDWVVYTFGMEAYDSADDDCNVKSMEKVELKTGKITKASGTTSLAGGIDTVYIDGAKYKLSKSDGKNTGASFEVKDVVDYVVDPFTGYIVYIKVSEKAINLENIAFIENAADDVSYGTTHKATLRFADGSKKVVETDRDYSSYIYNLCTFNVVDNYELTFDTDSDKYYYYGDAFVTGDLTTLAEGASFDTGDTSIKADTDGGSFYNINDQGTVTPAVTFNNVRVNGNTTFVVMSYNVSTGKTTANTYVGYKNAPDFDNASVAAYVSKDTGIANVVFVYAQSTTVKSNSDMFIIFDKDSDITTDADNTQYYTYLAIVAGELKEVTVDKRTKNTPAEFAGDPDTNNGYVTAVSSYTTNKNGVITSIDVDTNSAYLLEGEKVEAVDAEVVKLNDTPFTFDDATKVYIIDKDLEKIVVTGDADLIFDGVIGTDITALTYVVDSNDADLLKTVIIVEK